MSDDWQAVWQPMIDAIGTDFGADSAITAVDEIEKGAVRKFCEPTEMDCPLFYDEQAAKAHGYAGIVAPYSGISQTWVAQAFWSPGAGSLYKTPSRDETPNLMGARQQGSKQPPLPPTSAAFATDIEIEYQQDAYVGDRLTQSGNRLLSVVPKETSVGRGAFMIYESYVRNQRGELIATIRRGLYQYNPHAK
jgi:hypothetical protein